MSSGFGQTASNNMKQTGYSNNYRFWWVEMIQSILWISEFKCRKLLWWWEKYESILMHDENTLNFSCVWYLKNMHRWQPSANRKVPAYYVLRSVYFSIFYYRVYLSISHPNTRVYWSHLTKRIGWRLKNINVWGHSSICRFLLILQILYIFLASKQQYLIIINLNARETGGEVERITQEIS